MTIFGDGKQQRAFSYIGDIALTLARSPLVREARNQVFNIGADQPFSVHDLAHEVARAMEAYAKDRLPPPKAGGGHGFLRPLRLPPSFWQWVAKPLSKRDCSAWQAGSK